MTSIANGPPAPPKWLRPLLQAGLGWLCCQGAASSAPETWPVAGQQGVLRFVIVPTELARDRAAYARQIDLLCQPGQTCFLNFYTNTAGAALTVPLPDAIDHEATAVFRRSMKQGAELMRWSCRLQITPEDCF